MKKGLGETKKELNRLKLLSTFYFLAFAITMAIMINNYQRFNTLRNEVIASEGNFDLDVFISSIDTIFLMQILISVVFMIIIIPMFIGTIRRFTKVNTGDKKK